MDKSGSLDEILKMGSIHPKSARITEEASGARPRQEVSKIVEVAVLFVLDIDDSPSVFASSHRLAINDDISLASNDRKRDQ